MLCPRLRGSAIVSVRRGVQGASPASGDRKDGGPARRPAGALTGDGTDLLVPGRRSARSPADFESPGRSPVEAPRPHPRPPSLDVPWLEEIQAVDAPFCQLILGAWVEPSGDMLSARPPPLCACPAACPPASCPQQLSPRVPYGPLWPGSLAVGSALTASSGRLSKTTVPGSRPVAPRRPPPGGRSLGDED